MKLKNIKKISAFALAFCMSLTAIAPAVAAVTTSGPTGVTTDLTRDEGSGANPIVKAKWEADSTFMYKDDSSASGAQFYPTGQYQVNREIAICAVVTDPDGLADVDAVYADVFYPVGIAVGDSHVKLPTQDGDDGAGCGVLMQEDSLKRLTKADGYDLFCRDVRTQNNNLPTFEQGYDYDEICLEDGELMKETAAVYCTTKELSYEDPSGDYKVWVMAQDNSGKDGILENHFTYLPMTAFETDFDTISYGNVKLNTHKIINGDLEWEDADNEATVRNVGNTRLAMRVMQDDMDLGKTDGNWNVRYDGRVGSNAAFVNYSPEVTKKLNGELDLSEMDEMDFSIEIFKFPPTHGDAPYIGKMTLSAVSVPHLPCDAS